MASLGGWQLGRRYVLWVTTIAFARSIEVVQFEYRQVPPRYLRSWGPCAGYSLTTSAFQAQGEWVELAGPSRSLP